MLAYFVPLTLYLSLCTTHFAPLPLHHSLCTTPFAPLPLRHSLGWAKVHLPEHGSSRHGLIRASEGPREGAGVGGTHRDLHHVVDAFVLCQCHSVVSVISVISVGESHTHHTPHTTCTARTTRTTRTTRTHTSNNTLFYHRRQ